MKYILPLLLLVSAGCVQQSKRNTSGTPVAVEDTARNLAHPAAEDTARSRLAAIRRIIHATEFIKLPYRIAFDRETEYTLPAEEAQAAGVSMYLYGVLPDTSHYYGFIEGLPADVMLVQLTVFDKLGNRIASEDLLEYNCLHMVEKDIYCDEYAVINEDLSIDYYYKSKYALTDMAYEGQRDTVCEHYEKKGVIRPDGTIFFEEQQEYECVE